MASNHVNVLLDDELHYLVTQHAETHGVTLSAALRDLLRRGLAVTNSLEDAGWREGYNAAWTAVRQAALDAIKDVSPTHPGTTPMLRR